MSFPITDLATLADLPQEQINRDLTRVIVKAHPLATKLDYITIDQMTNVIIGNKLTLSAPATSTPPGEGIYPIPAGGYTGNNLTVDAPVKFIVKDGWRQGFITGAQFLCSAGATNQIKCNTTDYNPETGELTGTVIDAEGTTPTINWTAAYLTSFFAAAAVEFTPTDPYPLNVTNVQAALDWLGDRFAAIVTTYEEPVLNEPKAEFIIPDGYNPDGLMVFVNGLLLNKYDYVLDQPAYTKITLNVPALVAAEFKSISFKPLLLTDPIDAALLDHKPPAYYLNYSNMTGSLSPGTVVDGGTFPP